MMEAGEPGLLAGGVYRWFCRAGDSAAQMCGMGTGWTGRGEEGFMAGRVIVV